MKQKKYTRNGQDLFEVTFISSENEYFQDEKPTTHTAQIIFDGYWYWCFRIDDKLANSLWYRSPKAAAKNAWIIYR